MFQIIKQNFYYRKTSQISLQLSESEITWIQVNTSQTGCTEMKLHCVSVQLQQRSTESITPWPNQMKFLKTDKKQSF